MNSNRSDACGRQFDLGSWSSIDTIRPPKWQLGDGKALWMFDDWTKAICHDAIPKSCDQERLPSPSTLQR